jgi:hypothetical protein
VIDTLLILGASGDLAGRYLLPALAQLEEAGRLPQPLDIVGVAREDWDTAAFRRHLAAQLERHAAAVDSGVREALVAMASYQRAEASDAAALGGALDQAKGPVVAYPALPPGGLRPRDPGPGRGRAARGQPGGGRAAMRAQPGRQAPRSVPARAGCSRGEGGRAPTRHGQRTTLLPDPVGHRNPAEVMEQARGPDLRGLRARAAQRLHPGRRERSHPERMLRKHLTLRSTNSPNARATESSPAPGIVATGSGSTAITRARHRGRPPRRRRRRLWIAGLGERDQVVGDPDDPKRPRDLRPGGVRRHPVAVPPRHQLPERTGHPVGHPHAPGQQTCALAEAGRHYPELLLAADQLPGDQPHPLGKRPVLGQPTRQVGQHFSPGSAAGAEHLRSTLETDLVASHPAREVEGHRGAAHVGKQSDVVHLAALLSPQSSRSASSRAARQIPSSRGRPRPRSVASESEAISFVAAPARCPP